MATVRECRKTAGMSVKGLAARCGVARQSLMKVESGRALPSPEMAARVEKALGCGPLLCTDDLLTGWPVQPYEFEPVNPECWNRALADWSYSIEKLGLSGRLVGWMLGSLPSDSGLESYNLLQLAGLGGRGQVSNPHSAGFRGVPIVDHLGKALGDRALAGLQLQLDELTVLLWPQVRLRPHRTSYRVDGLVALRCGPRVLWSTMEVDGPRHDPEWDKIRQSLLRLEPIRLSEAQVRNRQSASAFVAQARQLLATAA